MLQGYVDDADGRRLNNYPGESVIINLADDGENASFLGEDGLKYSNPVFRVTNELHKCSIQIMKSSADEKPLENVIFGLYDESRQKILESQTNQRWQDNIFGAASGEILVKGRKNRKRESAC